jgi:hypothetical protein
MSQMTSTARVGARALNRPTTTPRLRVVTGAPQRRGGATFGIICATLLAAGLIGLLLLNTSLAQGSFILHDLRADSDQLSDTQDALSQSLAATKSPASLATRAASMGLVPGQSSAFLRLSDGKVIGVATPASAGRAFNVVRTIGSDPAPAAAKQPKAAPSAGGLTSAGRGLVGPAKPATR